MSSSYSLLCCWHGYFAFSKRLASSSSWKATVTPLASIMGSGFLVSAPLLAGTVGNLAVVCMALQLVLPLLLSVAAIGSQFSASVADNAGTGGLIEDISHRKLPIRCAYLLIILVAIAITRETDVNEIIAYASRAFVLYYMLQCVVAFVVGLQQKELKQRTLRLGLFASLSTICLLVFVLGIPSG